MVWNTYENSSSLTTFLTYIHDIWLVGLTLSIVQGLANSPIFLKMGNLFCVNTTQWDMVVSFDVITPISLCLSVCNRGILFTQHVWFIFEFIFDTEQICSPVFLKFVVVWSIFRYLGHSPQHSNSLHSTVLPPHTGPKKLYHTVAFCGSGQDHQGSARKLLSDS